MHESIVFLVPVQCRRKESSRSLCHLLMSFLSFYCDPHRCKKKRFTFSILVAFLQTMTSFFLFLLKADRSKSSQQQPGFVSEAEAAAAFLCRQFDVVVDPDGTLIHARRRTSETSVFSHCRSSATLGAKHDRLEKLLQLRARLELTRLVAAQVRVVFSSLGD